MSNRIRTAAATAIVAAALAATACTATAPADLKTGTTAAVKHETGDKAGPLLEKSADDTKRPGKESTR